MLVAGFPSFDVARDYARRRMRDSVEELRTGSQSAEELRLLWLVFGEDSLVVGADPLDVYCGYADLDRFIDTPASAAERDWLLFAKRFDLWARPITV